MAAPDRVRLKWALLDLIAAAYGVRATQVSGPEWLEDDVFDVEATVPVGTKKEALNGMLQSLLEERFGLKVHEGPKTEKGFALVVGKDGPKLQLAEASPPVVPEGLSEQERKDQLQKDLMATMTANGQHMRERVANGAVGKDYNHQGWASMTTEELAAWLVRPVGAPVVDETGLTGKYPVTLETWSDNDVAGGTIFDAVEKLGLKLEPRKVTVETVVVDHISKVPTEN